jgi:hypothetical protein
MEDSLAESLARDRAGIDADAAQNFAPLDDGHTLPHFRALDRRSLTGRARSDNDQVIALHCDSNLADHARAALSSKRKNDESEASGPGAF